MGQLRIYDTNSSSWIPLVAGAQGATGTQGSTGTQGTQGIQGTQGTTGSLGTQGIQGGFSFALGTGVQNFLTTPSSSNLSTAVTDETGSGALVFGTSPTLKGPVYFQSGGGAGGTANKIDVNNTTGAVTLTSGYPLNLTATGDVTITATGGAAKVGSDTIVTLTASQTMTNKTLTSPSVSDITLTGTLTAGGATGTSGQTLTSTGTGVQWSTPTTGATLADVLMLGGM